MQQLPKIHKQQIALVAGSILIAAGVLVGLTVFIFMQRHAQDSTQLNAPLRMQLGYLIALVAGVLGLGLLLLRWQLGPRVASLIRSEAAAEKHAAALSQEIVEHRQVEAELLMFKNVLDNTLDMIFMFVPHTFRFVYLSQGATLGTGYSREELLGMSCCQITPLLSEFKFPQGIASVLLGEQLSYRFDTLCRRKDGTDFPVSIFLQVMTQSDGTQLFVAIASDITERKKTEQMKSDFISVMYQRNSEAMTVADSKGMILSVNPAFTRITGFTQQEVIGKNPSMLSSGRHDQAFYQTMWNEINTVGHWGGEIWNRRKNGEIYLQWITINAISDEDGLVYRYVGLFSDISKKRQAKIERDALRHANQMKSEFLANMAHELRTPLNAIIGFSEALKEGLLGDLTEQQTKYIGHVFDSGKFLLSLINDILDLSKVEAGKMVLDLEPVAISSLLENSLFIIKDKATAHNILLELDEALGDIGMILADARKVKQIVYNLLSNAVKFSNEGGTVTLQARRVARGEVGKLSGPWPGRCFPLPANEFEEFFQLSVTDGGIGISSAGMEKLVQPFSQIDSGLARKYEGTGLGLVMIKNLAELHGGTLALESAENEGSRFTVWLPLRPAQDALTMVSVPAGIESLAPEPIALALPENAG
jgi:PAS domain S-box-containing protein